MKLGFFVLWMFVNFLLGLCSVMVSIPHCRCGGGVRIPQRPQICSHLLRVRISPLQGEDMGSNPIGNTNIGNWCNGSAFGLHTKRNGSIPLFPTIKKTSCGETGIHGSLRNYCEVIVACRFESDQEDWINGGACTKAGEKHLQCFCGGFVSHHLHKNYYYLL